MGIKRLEDVNEALIFKWVWRFRSNQGALWKKVIEVCHKSNNMWEILPVNKYAVGNWKSIVKVAAGLKVDNILLFTYIRAKVGCGNTVRFWLDVWLGDCALKHKFPLLYRLENNKKCWVSERTAVVYNKRVVTADWIDNMFSADELVQWVNLCDMLNGIDAGSRNDEWVWAAATNAEFSTNAATKMLMQRSDFGDNFNFKWVSWVPLKCSIMAWRAEMNRLPTKMALLRRNISIADGICTWCNDNDETVMHILSDCIIASSVWDWIGKWCRLDPIYAFEVKDLLEVYKSVQGCKKKKNIVHGIMVVTMWSLWNARNDMVFNGTRPNVEKIVARVKSLTYLWVKSRYKCYTIVWKDWYRFPLYMFIVV